MTLNAMQRRDRHHTGELFFAAALFLASAGFVLWQNFHLTVLWDLSYILENATRISLGQRPYRDFPFPYAPLTFFAQAAIIRLFGRVVWHHQLYSAFAGGLGTLLTWSLLRRVFSVSTGPWRWIGLALAAPLVFLGTNSIFPHPFYDSDSTVFILFWLWLWLRCEEREFPRGLSFLCGVLMVVPLFIKQNTGLAFFASAAVCVAWMLLCGIRRAWLLVAGAAVGLAGSVALIQFFFGLGNYLHWTIGFAASRRLPGVATMLGVYQDSSLLWPAASFAAGIILWMGSQRLARSASPDNTESRPHEIKKWIAGSPARWIAAALLLYPFAASVAALFLEDNDSDRIEALLRLWPIVLVTALLFALARIVGDTRHHRAPSVLAVMPFILLGTIHGAFLSQQLWGSTYALWPMFVLLLAGVLAALFGNQASTPSPIDPAPSSFTSAPLAVLTAIIALLLTANGAYYALCHERLDYVALDSTTGNSASESSASGNSDSANSAAKDSAASPDDSLHHSHQPALRGLAMRGPWLGDFDELAGYAARNIPAGDAILEVPGEDLFYFATGRTPQFPVILMDNTVNPYSAAELATLARQKNVRWVIVKRRLQLQEQPISFHAKLIELLSADFHREEQLADYDIYRRR
jgi:hypothetical protein